MNWTQTRQRLIAINPTFANLPEAWEWRIALRGAALRGAALRGAALRGADLRGADLSDAALSDADLSGADLSGADLRGADLSDAALSGADLSGADLRGADLRGAEGLEIPVIPNIDKVIYDAIQSGGNLDMSQWHSPHCATTHCRAGWTVTLAGEIGLKLEEKFGTSTAAALIYMKSRPGQPIPNWYAENEEVLAELEEAAKATVGEK